MPTVIEFIDLSLFACPMYYIGARESLGERAVEQDLLVEVNKGNTVDEVLNSLRKEDHICKIVAKQI